MAAESIDKKKSRRNQHLVPLLWKNWLLKKRHWVATAVEIVLPVMFIILFAGLKTLENDVRVPKGYSSTTENKSIPVENNLATGTRHSLFSVLDVKDAADRFKIPSLDVKIPKFQYTETTMPGLLLGMGLRSANEGKKMNELTATNRNICMLKVAYQGYINSDPKHKYALPNECQGKISPYKIAIAPDNEYTRNYFLKSMSDMYPRLSFSNTTSPLDSTVSIFQSPGFDESVKFFASSAALDDYVSSDTYGSSPKNPKIYAGIIFDKIPQKNEIGKDYPSIEYTLRFNETNSDRATAGDTPSTKGDIPAYNNVQRSIKTQYYVIYAVRGFNTLQTIVNRFLNCLPYYPYDETKPCQSTQVQANATAANDALFLTQARNDILLNGAINSFNSAIKQPNAVSLSSMPLASLSLFLKPLRFAPQPFFGSTVSPFPIDSFVSSPFYDLIKDQFGLLFLLSYLYSISRVLTVFILEKETKMREMLKIVGIRESYIIFAWYLTYGLGIFTLTALLQSFISSVGGLFPNSNWLLLFLFFWFFSWNIVAFGFCISTLFSRAKTGAFVGMSLFFGCFFISYAVKEDTATEGMKSVLCLLPPLALSFGVKLLATVEGTSVGLSWANVSEPFDKIRFQTILLMLLVNVLLYSLLGLYLEQIIPKTYGTVKKWYFPFLSLFQKRKKTNANRNSMIQLDDVDDNNENVEEASGLEYRQQIAEGQCLRLQNLTKEFPNKKAVNELSLTMYSNQITCLLGHNGAGKTTTISMLTGMLGVNSGNAFFDNLNIREDMTELRDYIGMCPQHDVLYDDLTVEEHLRFYYRIKNNYTDKKRMDEEIGSIIQEVGLTEKANTLSAQLSGGMKRKLSISIALLGQQNKLVFLDEPTSGMDPYSRRSTWELIQNNREGRVIVLTTHFMDEADLLGDRIAIMSGGQLRCCGSSLFLKQRYGAGYTLTLAFHPEFTLSQQQNVIKFVSEKIPQSHVLSHVGSEVQMQLAMSEVDKFSDFFYHFEADVMKPNAVDTYGISITTLEEVFLRVADEVITENEVGIDVAVEDSPILEEDNTDNATSFQEYSDEGKEANSSSRIINHFMAFLLKRWWNAKRDKRAVIFSAVIPIVLLGYGLAVLKYSGLTSNQPRLTLSPIKSTTPLPYYCADSSSFCQSKFFSNPDLFPSTAPAFLGSSFPSARSPSFESTDPTVFSVHYINPRVNNTGFLTSDKFKSSLDLKMGEKLLQSNRMKSYGGFVSMISPDQNLYGYSLMTNTTSLHSPGIYKNVMDSALYSYFSGSKKTSSIRVNNHPLPLTASTKALFNSFLSFSACIFIVIAFAFYPASIVTFLVKERKSTQNAKHLQLISSGRNLTSFWLANFVWDLVMYIIPFSAALILIQLFNVTSFVGSDCSTCLEHSFGATIVLFFLFGLSIIPFAYCLSFLFKEYTTAQNLTLMINFLLGVTLLATSFILDVVDSTKDINKSLKYLWRLSPLFNLGNGLLNLSREDIQSSFGLRDSRRSAFELSITGNEITFLIVEIVVFSLTAILLDSDIKWKKKSSSSELEDNEGEKDEDVKAEEDRINANKDTDKDVLLVKGLRKVYSKSSQKKLSKEEKLENSENSSDHTATEKIAVKSLSFGLQQGDCFGFLGINGAGKTTTLKMLTGDVSPTKGEAYLNRDMANNIFNGKIPTQLIGYCPQFDGLLDRLTVQEHLQLYGRLKNIPSSQLDQVIEAKLHQLQLIPFRNNQSSTLSGGNKRKLSVAIALIGSPPILFLDEPSTGMDPVTRRYMWEVLSDVCKKEKATIVLTTHSMEECEALCTRVGIMVSGGLKCLGSIQHLKQRFGKGFTVEVKFKMSGTKSHAFFPSHLSEKAVLTLQDVEEVCTHHNKPVRFSWLNEGVNHETAWILAQHLAHDETLRAKELKEWWLLEDAFESLEEKLRDEFSNVKVVERHNNQCRFQILPNASVTGSLPKIFDLLQNCKVQQKYIQEYSVTQTSLEQIFNTFAAKQQEEMAIARGVIN